MKIDKLSSKTTPAEFDPRARSTSERIRVHSREVLSDQWATLEKVTFDYQRGDGRWQQQQREIYHRGHGAAVLLYNLEKRTIVLIRQFRFPAWTLGGDGFLLEVPAGMIEAENPAETVRAESEQETGFIIEEPRFLFRAYATPGSVTEQLYFYAAAYDSEQRSGAGGGLEEEGEDIEVLEVTIEQAVEWVASGLIMDTKTIIMVQHAQLQLFGV
ncbi:NUDIX domain-containing protein [Granulosicoccus antarcticus]|uniref:GDP-mannose pyrophosphatase n=1 Tax=Granulosicoccus antarcticus IMCC3135 TaxID=1192854 RepID=A0A2Z2NNZ1_9GAMM|nr:NUDIX domain-containing protein [Granulosicoccus antarcticus]ASJ71388.1 GDP-mannose pyrophosphatase NudK [Granulosicoccus antarcticus IMCC3135]